MTLFIYIYFYHILYYSELLISLSLPRSVHCTDLQFFASRLPLCTIRTFKCLHDAELVSQWWTLNDPRAASIGAVHGHLILHMQRTSVHRKVVKAFKVL